MAAFEVAGGISVKAKQIYIIHNKPVDAVRIGKPINTPIGTLHTVFSGRLSIGKMLDCPYLIGSSPAHEETPRLRVFRISTLCNQHIFNDEEMCIYSSSNYLFIGFTPKYPLDGDFNK